MLVGVTKKLHGRTLEPQLESSSGSSQLCDVDSVLSESGSLCVPWA